MANGLFDGGDGLSIFNPLAITDAEDLNALRLIDGNSSPYTTGIHAIQINDIDMKDFITENGSWIPFNGTYINYDGSGHKISNLVCSFTKQTTEYTMGLFGFIDKGSIKNVVMENTSFDTFDEADATLLCIGCIAGRIGAGGLVPDELFVINNCTVNLEVTLEINIYSDTFISNIGSVIGFLFVTTDHLESNGYINVNLNNCGESITIDINQNIGGIIGNRHYNFAQIDGYTVSYLKSVCDIRINTDLTGIIGGVIGCDNSGTIIDTIGTISYCTYYGKITNGYIVGGILGQAFNLKYIYKCYSHLIVYWEDGFNGTYYMVGGICGYARGTKEIIKCYTYNEVQIHKAYFYGGLIGELMTSPTGGEINVQINNCYVRNNLYFEDTTGCKLYDFIGFYGHSIGAYACNFEKNVAWSMYTLGQDTFNLDIPPWPFIGLVIVDMVLATDAEMKDIDTYENIGWDFSINGDWEIQAYHYPAIKNIEFTLIFEYIGGFIFHGYTNFAYGLYNLAYLDSINSKYLVINTKNGLLGVQIIEDREYQYEFPAIIRIFIDNKKYSLLDYLDQLLFFVV